MRLKKILPILLCLALVLSTATTTVFADGPRPSGGPNHDKPNDKGKVIIHNKTDIEFGESFTMPQYVVRDETLTFTKQGNHYNSNFHKENLEEAKIIVAGDKKYTVTLVYKGKGNDNDQGEVNHDSRTNSNDKDKDRDKDKPNKPNKPATDIYWITSAIEKNKQDDSQTTSSGIEPTEYFVHIVQEIPTEECGEDPQDASNYISAGLGTIKVPTDDMWTNEGFYENGIDKWYTYFKGFTPEGLQLIKDRLVSEPEGLNSAAAIQ